MQQHPINNFFSKIFKYLLFRLQTSLKFLKKLKLKLKKKPDLALLHIPWHRER
jgi:hypothetical protein